MEPTDHNPRAALAAIYDDPSFDDQPLYPVGMASRALKIPTATLRWWVLGRDHHPAVIDIARREGAVLSFRNLCEAWVLNALRAQHGVPLQRIRRALDEIRKETGIARPLIDQKLLLDGTSIVYSAFGELVEAGSSRAGRQRTLFALAEEHLKRVTWDRSQVKQLFPWVTSDHSRDGARIVIDPRISFGRPSLVSNGVPVAVFGPRYLAGESIKQLAHEFGASIQDVEDAIRFLGAQAFAA